MPRSLYFVLAVLCFCSPVLAKPLITDSENTYVTFCQDREDTSERLIEGCRKALEDANLSKKVRHDLLEVIGDSYRDLNQWEEARAAYESMMGLVLGDAAAQEGLGWVAFAQDDYAAAATAFEHSVSADPSGFRLAGMASAQYRIDALSLEDLNAYFDTAIIMAPEANWILREHAWINHDAGNFATARSSFKKALENWDEDINAHYGLSNALYELEDFTGSVHHASEAIALTDHDDPALHWFHERRSFGLWSLGRYRQALKDADFLMEHYADRSTGYVMRARILSDMGRVKEAVSVLSEAKVDEADQYYVTYWLAEILYTDQQFDPAWDATEGIKHNNDADGYLHKLRAEIALSQDDTPKARLAVGPALMTEGAWLPWAMLVDARILIREDRFEEAQARFKEALLRGLPLGEVSVLAKEMVAKGEFKRAAEFGKAIE
ncbi:tetratricopeptide repeat protein [Cognatishimia maritima]|uniref:Tetratricopeptide repeat-containing protein n=1 Tax=Cognatishimia maritima TaxID=870908 RepID=A0A1M5MRI7_9RHOB|nr:tetratricopeptide repeat protein [Cognatishimia maritima]SHG79918.1 Tetratricopeptide repeat-containing protein [Cognatishimia maritima]